MVPACPKQQRFVVTRQFMPAGMRVMTAAQGWDIAFPGELICAVVLIADAGE